MSIEPSTTTTTTTADRRTEQLSRLTAEKDARLRRHRDRPLPPWLTSRGNRRAVAMLPLVPLACGLVAGTRPDSVLRSTLLAAVALSSVAGILVLRWVTRLLDAVPDRLLDEREIGERDRAYRRAHGLVVGLIGLLMVLAVADGVLSKVTGSPLIPGDGWIAVTISTMLVATMVPAAVLAWRWTDAPADLD